MRTADRALAARYTQALFQCACARGEEAVVRADLEGCAALAGAAAMLRDPCVATARKKSFVRECLRGGAAAITADFLELLVENKRFYLLPLVIRDFDKLCLRKRGVVRARLRAAKPLAEADRARLRAGLEAFAGCGVELDFREDPELLGGVSVRLGDWLLDGSLRGQLQSLKEAMGGD